MVDRVGQQLGNYRLVRLLGRGGFAEVYLGEHIRLGTQTAIKVLHAQLANQEIEDFQREARIIAHLEHPHIVRVFDFDVVDGVPFLVMSYASNGTLRQRHTRGILLPLPSVVSYVKQVADALQYAHDEKLIHRDVKPENMLVGRRNEILLSDFGIATVAQSSQYQSTQNIVGTVAYMAPEQIQGKPRPASDQYALGIVAYEWLSGTRPFQGSFTEVATQHVLAPPPPLYDRVPGISSDLESVIFTALEKDPHRRFATIQAFANALEQASREKTIHPIASPVQALPTLPASSFIPPSPPQASSASIENVDAGVPPVDIDRARLQTGTLLCIYRGHSGPVGSLACSPDGNLIASGSDDGTVQIWEATTGKQLFTYHGHSGPIFALSWSPDGKKIASGGNDQTVQVWAIEGGQRLFTYRGHTGSILSVAWTPEGDCIASGSEDQTMQVWHANTGDIVFSYEDDKSSIWAVAWSSDDNYLAFDRKNKLIQVCDSVEGNQVCTYPGHTDNVWAICWSPDSRYIASGGDDKTIQVWIANNGRKSQTCIGHSDSVVAITWSPDGRYIASGSEDHTVRVWDAATGYPIFTYRGHSDSVDAIIWSPDSAYIASASGDHTVQIWAAPE